MYCNAATPPAYIRLLTSYMGLWPWAVSQDNFEESTGLQLRRNLKTGAHDCESQVNTLPIAKSQTRSKQNKDIQGGSEFRAVAG